MTIGYYDRPAAFRIGRVFGDTFNVLGRNLALCAGLTVILSGIPTFLYQLWIESRVVPGVVQDAAAAPSFGGTAIIAGLAALVIYMVLGSILQAALVRATIDDLNGNQSTFGDALARAVAVLLPVVGVSLLMGLGIGLGFMLLVVPGVYLLVRWAVSVPILVNERLGVFESMKRSSMLTKGSRWRLLGLFVILFVAITVIQMALGLLTVALTPVVGTIVATALAAVLSAISSVVISIAVAVSYVELRYVKEGADVKELAAIFA